MEYAVSGIDINDRMIRSEINALISEVFGYQVPEDKLLLNTQTRNGKSLYLGAFKEGKLVAVNFFIAHELQYNESTVIAHQSCWSATSPQHRKKGLFSLLINTAKERLMDMNSAFIFGFPNVNSAPIFIHKLGFRRLGMSRLNIPVYGPSLHLLRFYVQNLSWRQEWNTRNCFIPVEAEIIELKEKEFGSQVKVYGAYNNLIWGKVRYKESAVGRLRYFSIGGVQVNKPCLLPELFTTVARSEKVHFLQLVGVSNNRFWDLLRAVQPADRSEPLIIFDLHVDTSGARFNFLNGIKDVF